MEPTGMTTRTCVVFHTSYTHQSSPGPEYQQCCWPAHIHTATEFSTCPTRLWYKIWRERGRYNLWRRRRERKQAVVRWMLRLGFMCGFYEPPRGSEQEGHGQLCNRISQNFRGVTNTDSSKGKAQTGANKYQKHTESHTFLDWKTKNHLFFSSPSERWSNPTDMVLTTFRFGPAERRQNADKAVKPGQGFERAATVGWRHSAWLPAASNNSASIFSVSTQSRASTLLTFWSSSFLGTEMSSESHSSNCTLERGGSDDNRNQHFSSSVIINSS